MSAVLAPAGRLRVGVWMVPYFARRRGDRLDGVIPDLCAECARRIGVPVDLRAFEAPGPIVEAMRSGAIDVTFLGVTADRAEAIDFGPVVLAIETTYLVPPSSSIAGIAEIDRPGLRIAVPARSAQEAHLRTTLSGATLIPVPAETPVAALDLLRSGEADAFSHVAPMLAAVQDGLPGSWILPGSYFDVPVAIGVARGRPPEAGAFAREFAEDVKTSGFVQAAIDRAGVKGMVVVK
ncbi:MAG: transporter substrate-binding domain-containing protein [Xanthobacteraceae bacterium]